MVKRRYLAWASLFCVVASVAHAQGALATFPDQILAQFAGQAGGWVPVLTAYARRTFYTLVLISFAWKIGQAVIGRSAFEQIIAELVELIMFIGLGALFLAEGPALLKGVIDSFRIAGGVAGQVGISPTDILTAGFEIAGHVWSQMSIWSPGATAGLVIVAVLLLVCVGWIAGQMVIGLVQTIFYIPVAMLFSAFLGSFWTRPMAMSVLMQSFALGAKLMMLELLAGSSLGFIRSTIPVLNDFTAPNAGIAIMVALIIAMLISVLPNWMAGIVGGVSIGEAGMVARAAIGTAGAALGGTVAVGGGAVAVGAAGRLAGTQMAAAEAGGAAAKSGFARAASIAGSTARNIGASAAQDVGLRLSGQGSRHGSAPWRAAASMNQQRRLINDDMNKPGP